MLGLIPFVCLAAIILATGRIVRRFSPGADWRLTVLAGAAIWGGIIFAMTELLSLPSAITFANVLIAWLVVLGASVIVYLRSRPRTEPPPPAEASKPKVKPAKKPKDGAPGPPSPDRLTTMHYVLLAVAGLIVAGVFLVAIISPPNNWDSMTYHLPRVEHWIQNHNVEHYPTHIIRQLYLNAYAEYVILHVRLLGGSDRLVNMVQFAAMLGALLAVSLIAKLLGSRIAGQVYAVVVCASIPMGILQASSTQTDYVTAFWLSCVVACCLQLRREQSLGTYALAGLSLALALQTKASSLLFAAPFLLWLAVNGIRRLRWRAWKPALTIAAICVIVNVPYMARNQKTFGPAGDIYGLTNATFTPANIASNIVRNLALHIATDNGDLNMSKGRAVMRIHEWLGVDPDDTRTTFPGTRFTLQDSIYFPILSYNEDLAGNTWHLAAGIAAIVFVLANPTLRRRRELMLYVLCLVTGFLIFCVTLRWQPWHSRLHLPVFVLGAPIIATAMDRLPRLLSVPAALLLALASYSWVTENQTRPMTGGYSVFSTERNRLYFMAQPGLFRAYSGIADAMKNRGIRRIGVIPDGDGWEYPLWVLMRDRMGPDIAIDHVRVDNVTGKLWNGRFALGSSEPPPPAVVDIRPQTPKEQRKKLAPPQILYFTDGRAWPQALLDRDRDR